MSNNQQVIEKFYVLRLAQPGEILSGIVQETVKTISEPSMMTSENLRMGKIAKGREMEYLPLKKGRGRTREIYRLMSSCFGSRKDIRYVCLFRN